MNWGAKVRKGFNFNAVNYAFHSFGEDGCGDGDEEEVEGGDEVIFMFKGKNSRMRIRALGQLPALLPSCCFQ